MLTEQTDWYPYFHLPSYKAAYFPDSGWWSFDVPVCHVRS